MTWRGESSLLTTASAEAVWHRWTTLALWPEDDPGCRWARATSPAAVGVQGKVKSTGPAQKFTFTELEVNRRMVFQIKTPLGLMSFPHDMEPRGDNLLVKHGIEITGPLAPLLGFLVGRGLLRELPAVVANVVDNALKA